MVQVQGELHALHIKEASREQTAKQEIAKAKAESKQDAHETTAKAAAKAKTFALFKIEQTKMKSKEHSELSAKAAHASAVLNHLTKGPAPEVESIGEPSQSVASSKSLSLSQIMNNAKSIIDRVTTHNGDSGVMSLGP